MDLLSVCTSLWFCNWKWVMMIISVCICMICWNQMVFLQTRSSSYLGPNFIRFLDRIQPFFCGAQNSFCFIMYLFCSFPYGAQGGVCRNPGKSSHKLAPKVVLSVQLSLFTASRMWAILCWCFEQNLLFSLTFLKNEILNEKTILHNLWHHKLNFQFDN